MASLDSESPTVFPSPFTFQVRDPCTLVELRMRYLSGKIRSKPQWWEKVHDAALVAKWRQEMVDQDRAAVEKVWGLEERLPLGFDTKHWPRDLITEAQLDYIFDELRYFASCRDEATGIYATSIPKVYESRSLIPAHLKSALLQGASIFVSVPDDEKDWHPGSDGQVLDLVHPSLYCLRIGRSHVYADKNSKSQPRDLRVLTEEEYKEHRPDFEYTFEYEPFAYSSQYQWLPTDFEISDAGVARPLSYINNLHPVRHRELYPTISSILGRFIPLFERILSDAISPEPGNVINVDPHRWYDYLGKEDDEDGDEDGEDDEDEDDEEEDEWPLIPDPPPFQPPSEEGRKTISLHGRTLQVIVKLANIVLTPEKPRYEGGAWHVEGMANERIVATGLYYYACENITESRLDFRVTVGDDSDEMPYRHGDYDGYLCAYGFWRGHELNQQLGHIVAEEDKCVAFPNVYQHHVDAFELADPSKPGYRKILCFFLVNPMTQIVSTSDVPPQQQDWVAEDAATAEGMKTLPRELHDFVVKFAQEGTISREEAEKDREELMKERASFVMQHNKKVFEVKFNMCEH